MNAEEIIRFIHDAKKTTPVKAYVKAAGDVELDVYKRQAIVCPACSLLP